MSKKDVFSTHSGFLLLKAGLAKALALSVCPHAPNLRYCGSIPTTHSVAIWLTYPSFVRVLPVFAEL